MKISPSKLNDASFSSLALTLLALTFLATYCLPVASAVFPLSWSSLAFFAGVLTVLLVWATRSLCRPGLKDGSSPLFVPLLLLLGALLVHQYALPLRLQVQSLLAGAGMLLAFVLLSLALTSLIRQRNTAVIVNGLLFVSLLASLLEILTQWLPLSLPLTPGLNFPLILLGLVICCAQFFKKGKFKLNQLFVAIPLLTLGLCASFISRTASPFSAVFDLDDSVFVLKETLWSDTGIDWSAFFLGQGVLDFADVYARVLPPSGVPGSQSLSTPFTLLLMFGFPTLFSWGLLGIFVFCLAFSRRQSQAHLYFILALTFVIACFTPLSPLLLLIQALLVACSLQRKKSATSPSQQKTDKWVSVFNYTRALGLLLLVLGGGLGLTRTYMGYYYYERALAQKNDFTQFVANSTRPAQIAPYIDGFFHLAGVAHLEQFFASLVTSDPTIASEPALEEFYASVENFELASAYNPAKSDWYLDLAMAYQEVSPYLDEASLAHADRQITVAYAQAIAGQPKNSQLHLRLAGYFQSKDNLESALSLYQKALDLDPTSLTALFQLATIWEAQGDITRARAVYIDVINMLNPADENYQENYTLASTKLAALQ